MKEAMEAALRLCEKPSAETRLPAQPNAAAAYKKEKKDTAESGPSKVNLRNGAAMISWSLFGDVMLFSRLRMRSSVVQFHAC